MNIFAQELENVLRTHGKELSSLFGLRVPDPRLESARPISPNKVVRLKRSLSRDITATLNSEELEALQAWVPLDPDGRELRHLRAALVAEGVRHLLAGRIRADQASHLGQLTLQSLVDEQGAYAELWRETLLDEVRHVPDEESDSVAPVARGADALATAVLPASDAQEEDSLILRALEPVAEAYERGALWLAIALDTPDRGSRLGFIALAASLFERARDLTLNAPTIALDAREQADWLATIETALAECGMWR